MAWLKRRRAGVQKGQKESLGSHPGPLIPAATTSSKVGEALQSSLCPGNPPFIVSCPFRQVIRGPSNTSKHQPSESKGLVHKGIHLHLICQQQPTSLLTFPFPLEANSSLQSSSDSCLFCSELSSLPFTPYALSPPMTGTERFSARDTTLGRSQGSRTMGSKKVEWGAATRTGA